MKMFSSLETGQQITEDPFMGGRMVRVGDRPTALAVGAGGGCFGYFYSHLSFLSSVSLSLRDGPI